MSLRDGGSIRSSATTEEELEEARKLLLDHREEQESGRGEFICVNVPL